MRSETILKKAVEKAVREGYKPDGLLGAVLEGEIGVGLNPDIYLLLIENRQYFIYIFETYFARCFFGDEIICFFCETNIVSKRCPECDKSPLYKNSETITRESWQYHLQIMVLEKNPIQYLKYFLKEEE